MKHKKARIINLNTNDKTKWLLDIWGDFFFLDKKMPLS